MAFKKQVLKVKEGDLYTFNGQSDYFTNGRGDYRVGSIEYDNGSNTTFVEILDDEGDVQTLSDNFLNKNFTKNVVKKNRYSDVFKK